MNAPMKGSVHRVVQQPQRSPVVTSVQSNQVSVVSEAKTSVIQTTAVRINTFGSFLNLEKTVNVGFYYLDKNVGLSVL